MQVTPPEEFVGAFVHTPLTKLKSWEAAETWDERTSTGRISEYDSAHKRWKITYDSPDQDGRCSKSRSTWVKTKFLRDFGPQHMRTAESAKTPSQERIQRYLSFAQPQMGAWLRQIHDAPANQQRWHIRARLECNATWARKDPDHCACGALTRSGTHAFLRCPLLGEIRPPLASALADFVKVARFTGIRASPEEAAEWIHTGEPKVPPSPMALKCGQALRRAACAFSAKAVRRHTDHLSSTRAASTS